MWRARAVMCRVGHQALRLCVQRLNRWGWGLSLSIVIVMGLSGAPAYSERPLRETLIEKADDALERRDGIKAEIALREALSQGVSTRDINALMGQAMMIQGRLDRARTWLGAAQFSDTTAAAGWRSLGLLERLEGNLPASGSAYDQALKYIPNDASLWVEIGRLRYDGGEHLLAIQASIHALELDANNVRALEFRGQLIRDRYGMRAAIPWFERGIVQAPEDITILSEYAATLGEMGRARDCLAVTRRILELDPKNARAYYLQAVIAARAGDYALAKGLLGRVGGKLDDLPGVQILHAVIEIASNNPEAASEAAEAVLLMQPDNARANDLLARAIMMAGRYRYMTLRFAEQIENNEASAYTLTLVARAWEVLDNRQRAGELLDRAARADGSALRILTKSGPIGQLLQTGPAGLAEAERETEAMRKARPGFYDAQSLAGDVQLAMGHPIEAQKRYAQAAEIRMSDNLFLRRYAAYSMARDIQGAQNLVQSYLLQNPISPSAMRMGADVAVRLGDPHKARSYLTWLKDNGGTGDVALLSELALVDATIGDGKAAQENALTAFRLQRSSPIAAQALGYTYMTLGIWPIEARGLLEKARVTGGNTPLISDALKQLDARAKKGVRVN